MSSIPSHVPAPSTKRFNGLMGFRGKGYRVRIVSFLYERFVKFINRAERIGGPMALAVIIFFILSWISGIAGMTTHGLCGFTVFVRPNFGRELPLFAIISKCFRAGI